MLVPLNPNSIIDAFAITPNDGVDLAIPTRAIYIGGAGNIRVMTEEGHDVVFTAIAVGIVHPLRVTRVFATNTTATLILGLL
jgi:hypothetical protein